VILVSCDQILCGTTIGSAMKELITFTTFESALIETGFALEKKQCKVYDVILRKRKFRFKPLIVDLKWFFVQ
jgi:hypothetical protein